MLDSIIEIVLELILDGIAEAAGSKKVPMPIRIALGVFLALLVFGLFGLLMYVGISSGSVVLIVLCAVLIVAAITWATFKVKKFKAKRK